MKVRKRRSQTLVSCPFCGEAEEIYVDLGGGTAQEYVEDCPVCCRPRTVHVEPVESDDGEVRVWLERAD
jgi:hypothetical protein